MKTLKTTLIVELDYRNLLEYLSKIYSLFLQVAIKRKTLRKSLILLHNVFHCSLLFHIIAIPKRLKSINSNIAESFQTIFHRHISKFLVIATRKIKPFFEWIDL